MERGENTMVRGKEIKPKEASYAWTRQTNATSGFKKKIYIHIPHICDFSSTI